MSSTPLPSGTDTPYYPLLLNLSGKICLVIGGGAVAERKVRMLLKFGASVKVVSPEMSRKLLRWAEVGKITIRRGNIRKATLKKCLLCSRLPTGKR